MKKYIIPVFIVLFLSISFFVYYFLYREVTVVSEELTQEEVIRRVSLLVELPKEEPTIATVSNPETLRSQPFFKKANIGDKVLIYSSSGKVILYNPSRNIILDISPLRYVTSN